MTGVDGIDVDYLVIGAGAMGMAFTDTLLTDTGPEVTVALVDRRPVPGGHWNDAYPFVRLHQPSAFYGVNSLPLGQDRIDTEGWNAGLYELASGPEVCAYFDRVLRERFLASGRVRWLPQHLHDEDGTVRSLATGRATPIRAAKVVDATYQQVMVPAMRPPPYEVDDGVRCVPVNRVALLDPAEAVPDRYVIVGGGKTAMDAVLWLLGLGVAAEAITWIVPRDSWLLDRALIQPGGEFGAASLGMFATQMEAAAEATSIDDLFARLEAGGALLRIDPDVRPTMYRCATVTRAELDQLRRVGDVVRLGRVRRLSPGVIHLDQGTVEVPEGSLFVDCTADGLARRPERPVFEGDRLHLQPVRTCQQVFSAAFIAHIEATKGDGPEADEAKNALCQVVAHPDSDIDWLRTFLASTLNAATWQADPDLRTWLNGARLDAFSGAGGGDGPASERVRVGRRLLAAGPVAVTRIGELLAGYDAAPTS